MTRPGIEPKSTASVAEFTTVRQKGPPTIFRKRNCGWQPINWFIKTTNCFSVCLDCCCPKLPKIDNAVISFGGNKAEYKEDSVINYTCAENFSAFFADSIECKCENNTGRLIWRCPLLEYTNPVCTAGPTTIPGKNNREFKRLLQVYNSGFKPKL